MIGADVVDELHLTVCPTVFGGQKTPTMADGDGLQRLADAREFGLTSFKRVGNEWKIGVRL